MLSVIRLKELLSYNHETGIFTWNVARARGARVGATAGTLHTGGYLSIKVDGKRYFAHRLAWFYVNEEWPVHQIDHIDLSKVNNRISNLRDAEPHQNSTNTAPRNTGHLKGITKVRNRFWARIRVRGVTKYLGGHASAEAAHAAYCAAAEKHFGAFARTH